MLATLYKFRTRALLPLNRYCFSTATAPSIENYFATLDQLSKLRNESDKDYENYTVHMETY
jgi:hypothetical protein